MNELATLDLPQILAVVVGGNVVDVHLITFLFQFQKKKKRKMI